MSPLGVYRSKLDVGVAVHLGRRRNYAFLMNYRVHSSVSPVRLAHRSPSFCSVPGLAWCWEKSWDQ